MVGDLAARADLDEADGTADAHAAGGAVERRAVWRGAVDKLVRARVDVREERGAEEARFVVGPQQPLDRLPVRDRLRAPGCDAHAGWHRRARRGVQEVPQAVAAVGVPARQLLRSGDVAEADGTGSPCW